MGKWFRGFRLKMLLMTAVSSFVLWGVSVYVYIQVNELGSKIREANDVRIPLTQATNEMATSLQAAGRYTWTAIGVEDKVELDRVRQRILDQFEIFESHQKEVSALPTNEFTKTKLNAIKEAWPRLKTDLTQTMELGAQNTNETKAQSIKMMLQVVRPQMNKVTDLIKELNDYRIKLLAEGRVRDEKELSQVQNVLVVVSLLAVLVVSIFGFTISSKVAQMLNQVIADLTHHSAEVSSASKSLSSAAVNLSSGATETASSLEETVASTEELNSMVRTNADNAQQAAALAQSGRVTAEEGERNIAFLHEAVGEVSKASKEIEQIISVIDDIAFQTNLLALNAAVEAARAGEQGKGFAVVAEAVRNLAQRSALAAKDIANLIGDSVRKIESSRDLAEKGKGSLSQMVQVIHKISDINAEISTASQEQASGLSNISKAMNEIDRATQQNASSSEEISSTSEEMTSQSVSLENIVVKLKIMVEGRETDSRTEVLRPPAAVSAKVLKISERQNVVRVPAKEDHFEKVLPLEPRTEGRSISRVEGF